MGIKSIVTEMVIDIRTEVYPNILLLVYVVSVAGEHLFLVKSEEWKVKNSRPSKSPLKGDFLPRTNSLPTGEGGGRGYNFI